MEMSDAALCAKFSEELKDWPVEKLLGAEIGWVRVLKIEIENLKASADRIEFTACIHFDELETTGCTNPPLTSSRVSRCAWTANRATGQIQRVN